MFNFDFFNKKDDDEPVVKKTAMHGYRAAVVLMTTAETEHASRIYQALLDHEETKTPGILSEVFDAHIFEEGGDAYPLYKVLYKNEGLITDWEDKTTKVWIDRLADLEAAKKTKGGKEYIEELDEEIDKCKQEINKLRMVAHEQRKALHNGFLEYLNKKYWDKTSEITRIIDSLIDIKPYDNDPIHSRIVNPMFYYKKAAKDNEAYANAWYMIGFGALTSATGIAFLIGSLVTGAFSPYIVLFSFMSIVGAAMAWMGGKNAAQEVLEHRTSVAVEASLYSQERITQAHEFKKQHTNTSGLFSKDTAPLFLLVAVFIGLIIADFYLGGPLSALGSTLKIALLPEFEWALPKMSNAGFLSEMTIFSNSAADFMLVGAIGGAALKIIHALTAVSKNKTFMRIHTAVSQSYTAIFAAYSLCGSIAFPFTTPLLPMVVLPLAAIAFCFFFYMRVIKGEEKFVLPVPAREGYMGIGASPATTMTINFNSGMLYSALLVGLCVLTAFALIANPISFGVAFIVIAAVLAISQDQISAYAARSKDNDVKKQVGIEMKDLSKLQALKPSPVLDAVKKVNEKESSQPAAGATATGQPVLLSSAGFVANAQQAARQNKLSK